MMLRLPPPPPPPPKTTKSLHDITALEMNCQISHTQHNFPPFCQAHKARPLSLRHGLHVRGVAMPVLYLFSRMFMRVAGHFTTLPEKACLASPAGGRDPPMRTASTAAAHPLALPALLLSTPLSQHRSLISRDKSCSSITCRLFHLKPRALSVCAIP
jgi:hypothetical protein